MMAPIFQHPDGDGAIQYDAKSYRLFLSNESEGLSAYALIGPAGLRTLAHRLLALAEEMGVYQ